MSCSHLPDSISVIAIHLSIRIGPVRHCRNCCPNRSTCCSDSDFCCAAKTGRHRSISVRKRCEHCKCVGRSAGKYSILGPRKRTKARAKVQCFLAKAGTGLVVIVARRSPKDRERLKKLSPERMGKEIITKKNSRRIHKNPPW